MRYAELSDALNEVLHDKKKALNFKGSMKDTIEIRGHVDFDEDDGPTFYIFNKRTTLSRKTAIDIMSWLMVKKDFFPWTKTTGEYADLFTKNSIVWGTNFATYKKMDHGSYKRVDDNRGQKSWHSTGHYGLKLLKSTSEQNIFKRNDQSRKKYLQKTGWLHVFSRGQAWADLAGKGGCLNSAARALGLAINKLKPEHADSMFQQEGFFDNHWPQLQAAAVKLCYKGEAPSQEVHDTLRAEAIGSIEPWVTVAEPIEESDSAEYEAEVRVKSKKDMTEALQELNRGDIQRFCSMFGVVNKGTKQELISNLQELTDGKQRLVVSIIESNNS